MGVGGMPASSDMALLDPAAGLVRLTDACVRLRAASRPEDILDALAEDARALAGVTHAWAARLDGPVVEAVRSAARDTAPPLSAPPFARLLDTARPIARASGFVVATLLGSGGAAEGVLALPHSASTTPAEDAALDLVLAPLAGVAGFALEAARLRQRIGVVTRARELLLGSVSHDLRNPLNTFAMSAGLLRDDLERNDVDTARGISLVSRMDRATARMQAQIEDLVEASRIDARKIDYVVREEPAAQLVQDAIAAATAKPPHKSATVTCDTPSDDARVMADRGRTLQLLAKVIAFEAKATGEDGTIRLAFAREGDVVRFTARAIGPGGAPVAPPEEGRGGLSLLIARGLAEAQRGSFGVEPADALLVAFTLPAATP
jgi:signal transduction histidine kinase